MTLLERALDDLDSKFSRELFRRAVEAGLCEPVGYPNGHYGFILTRAGWEIVRDGGSVAGVPAEGVRLH